MTSRDAILKRISAAGMKSVPHPGVYAGPIFTGNSLTRFEEALRGVGATSQRFTSAETIHAWLEEIAAKASGPVYADEGVWSGATEIPANRDPATMETATLAVLRGEWAVAENGAIWVAGTTPARRAVLLLSRVLVLIISSNRVVPHMHDGYTRIVTTASPFGAWVSGPSKTADIEQQLVYGAHGPMELHVAIMMESP
jgi:L-lactate dehydrogenase complex protein LldG